LRTSFEIEESTSFQEAIDSPNHKEWMEAMRDKMDSIARNEVWKLSDRSPRCKLIGNKWVFKIKHQVDGSMDKFKARLVVKGLLKLRG